MIKKLLGLLVALALTDTAHAQIGPSTNGPFYSGNFYQGFVPTAQFWNLLESNKLDYNPSGLSVQYGGTGATNAAQARTNLGILSNSLLNGQIFIGNASNLPIGNTPSGDLTMTNAGIFSVNSLGHVTNATLPNSGLVNSGTTVNGTLCTLGLTCTITASPASPQALTKTNDTNITLTLGGTPSTALLQPTSITAGWTGTLAAARLNSSVVQAVTNDTNLTGSITAQNLTLGWTGTLAAARLNPSVVQSVINDTNVTGSISAQALTLGWTGTLANARLATMPTNTVKANVTSGTASPTDLAVGSCSGSSNALTWTTNTGFTCNGAIAAATASTVTTNANLTGPITSVGNATSIASQTGTGTTFVTQVSPSITTPNINVANGTSLALGGATIGSNALAVTGTTSFDGNVEPSTAGTLTDGSIALPWSYVATRSVFSDGSLNLGGNGTNSYWRVLGTTGSLVNVGGNSQVFGWSSGGSGTLDTGVSRSGAASFAFGNGTAADRSATVQAGISSFSGSSTAGATTAITAGGSLLGHLVSSTANFGVFGGSGVPTISAAQGSLYMRSDGAPYYNNNGTTGWTALSSGGSGTVNSGTANQLAYYASTGTAVSTTSAIPNGITATTQTATDNSTKVATTAYVDQRSKQQVSTFGRYSDNACATLVVGSNVASCAHSGTGQFTITFSTPYTSASSYTCVANIAVFAALMPVVYNFTSTTVTVGLINTTTQVGQDGQISFMCSGT